MEPDIWATKCFHVFNPSGQREDRFACKIISRKFMPEELTNFFQCHKPCWSPSWNLQYKMEVSLFCLYIELHAWAFPLWQTQLTRYSIFLSLFHSPLLSWMQNPDFAPGNTEQWVYSREGNRIPSAPAYDWSRDGRVTQFCQWDVRKHLVGGASREVAAFPIKRL